MRLLFTLILLASISTFATAEETAQLPFQPIRAADQPRRTSLALHEELEQLRAISQWQAARAKLEETQIKFQQAKAEYQRAQQRLKAGTLTSPVYGQILYTYRALEGELIRLPNDIVVAKMSAQFHGWRVMEEGNPGADYRLQIAQTMVEGLALQRQTLEAARAVAQTANALAQEHYADGKKLFAKKILSQALFELREVTAKAADVQLQEVERQINLVNLALESFNASLAALLQEKSAPKRP